MCVCRFELQVMFIYVYGNQVKYVCMSRIYFIRTLFYMRLTTSPQLIQIHNIKDGKILGNTTDLFFYPTHSRFMFHSEA
jgi:hypothetical protein